MDDASLLSEFVQNRSASAFSTLVARYQPMIKTAAVRQLSDGSAADDVTQAVLLTLMNKAATLPQDVRLGAWLHRVTRCHCVDHRRAQLARQKHERVAATLQTGRPGDGENRWEQLSTCVDDTLDLLGEDDRAILVSYYLQNQSAGQVGQAMGLRPAAVRQRVSRALQKLRDALRGKEFFIETAALDTLLTRNLRYLGPKSVIASSTLGGAKVAAILLVAGGSAAIIWQHQQSAIPASPPAVTPVRALAKMPLITNSSRPSSTTTPLILATMRRNTVEVARLLDGGAKVDEISHDGNNTSALLYAATLPGDSGLAITRLLVQHGADVNFRHGQWGYTAAMVAARNGSPRTVEYLAAHGAALDVSDRHGQTLTTMAAASGNIAVIHLVQSLPGS